MASSAQFQLEVCANCYTSALAAQQGGAVRVELCENMAEGGTTPSYAQIKHAKEKLHIEIWPIIRPRGGDFLYTDDEFEIMKEDIRQCKQLGCAGAVTGMLLQDGRIDTERCKALIELAKPMPLAFHRAFDMSNNLSEALEELIELGFVRVLTSGAAPNAPAGTVVIAQLVKQAGKRIEVMPGAGINPGNIALLRQQTGAHTFHTSARQKQTSKMTFRNAHTKMGAVHDEYTIEQTSSTLVNETLNALYNSFTHEL